jgi:hypothetical protein
LTPAGLRKERRILEQGRADGQGSHGSWDKGWQAGGGRREARLRERQRFNIPRKSCVVFLGSTHPACARLGTWKGCVIAVALWSCGTAAVAALPLPPLLPDLPPAATATEQGLPLVNFSAQLEPCLTQINTLHTLNTP